MSVDFAGGKLSGILVPVMGYVVYVGLGSRASTTLSKVIISTVRYSFKIKHVLS